MERARHQRSKSTTSIEGNFLIPKQKAVPKMVFDSHSYSEGINKEDGKHGWPLQFASQLGQNSLKRGSGTPIKNLLAEEMAKESEGRRRSPSVIARLMGLDGLPSPQHGHKPQRRSSDKQQQLNASKEIRQNKQPLEGRSSRRISVDQQHFKDVYEDLEASHVTNRQYSSNWSANSRLTKPEMALIQQKFMNAKRLSSNEKLQVSKEFDDTLEMLDLNKDLLRYLPQPDSLAVKHLHDLQIAPSSPFYGHLSSLEPSNSNKHECNAKSWKSKRDNTYKHEFSLRQKREDGLLLPAHSRHGSHNSGNPSKNYSDVKNEENMLPTRIVLLKPNIGRSGNCVTSVSSPASSHTHPSCRKHLECASAVSDEAASWQKKTSSRDVFSSNSKLREDREIAKEITRRMRDNFGLNILTDSGVKGYAGDESSYDAYESDSSSVSEKITLPSRHAFDGNNWFKRSSGPTESLVSKEAKKRLSERWKMTRGCQGVEPVGKGNTLGEMLAVLDTEPRNENFNAGMDLDGGSEKFARSNKISGWDGPLGISSRDGWKDRCVKSSSGLRSLPPTSLGNRSHRANGWCEALVDDLMTNEKIHRGRSKAKKASSGKPHPCHRKLCDRTDSSVRMNSSLVHAEISLNNGDQHEKHIMFSQEPTTYNICSNSITDVTADAKHESLISSSHSSVDGLFKHPDNKAENHDSFFCDQEDMSLQEPSVGQSEGGSASLQCPGPEPESSESSKEADHPSPISVLEVGFAEDVSSSSDCFETVNAELNGLRMQLQLLKMESEGYSDAPMLSASNKDMMQHPVVYEEKHILGGKSWESSYIVDVLLSSGLQEFELDTFFTMWHSPECPLDSWVFDDLEKMYCREKTGLNLERKLLVDQINSALLEFFQHYADPCPWVKPVIGAKSNWQKHGVKDTLCKLLANQENLFNGGRPEKMMDREMNWLGFRADIDIVGKEIEKLLLDDLIGEVVTL